MMEYRGYTGKVEFDPDAKILHGEIIGIRDVVTFQGHSVAEVEQAFRDSLDDYLAFCAERGERPDKPYSGQFVVRLDSDLHRKANMIAGATGKSLNTFVSEAIAGQIQRQLPQRGKTKPAGRPLSQPQKRRAAG